MLVGFFLFFSFFLCVYFYFLSFLGVFFYALYTLGFIHVQYITLFLHWCNFFSPLICIFDFFPVVGWLGAGIEEKQNCTAGKFV